MAYQQQQQQQRALPSVSAAVDAVIFLAGCVTSPHCRFSISRTGGPDLQGPPAGGPQTVNERASQHHMQQEDGWVLLGAASFDAEPREALPLRAVTSLFTSLQQHITKLPRSAVSRLLCPLFLLGFTLGAADTGGPPDSTTELRALSHSLLQLLQDVLKRAAAEAPLLPAAETVQRVSAVANPLADWGRRGVKNSSDGFLPLLLLAQIDELGPHDADWPTTSRFQGTPSEAFPEGPFLRGAGRASALAAALQRMGAPALPQGLLHAAANMMEASATAAANGLKGEEPLKQQEAQHIENLISMGIDEQQQQQQGQGIAQQQQLGLLLKKPTVALRQLVAASEEWMPVYYLLLRISRGIWIPALEQLAEAAAQQKARFIQFFLSQQQEVRDLTDRAAATVAAASGEVQRNTWSAVGLLYGELQQMAVSLAHMHSLKPLRGMRRFAAAADAFERYLSSHTPKVSFEGHAAAAVATVAAATVVGGSTSLLRPLLCTQEPPRDLREAERRIRYFCSLVSLGANCRSLASGVAACLPSESQLHTLGPLPVQQQQQQQQSGCWRFRSTEAAAECFARQISLQLLQRLLISCSFIDATDLVSRGLKVLRLRLETFILQHLLRAPGPSRFGSSSTTTTSTSLEAAAASNRESYTAELVGKTLAVLHKAACCLSRNRPEDRRREEGTQLSQQHFASSSFSFGEGSEERQKEGEGRALFREALCGLASTATLWAAVTGFDKQRPEDVALLTFSLMPFWLKQKHQVAAADATPLHSEQQVHHIRAAAVESQNQRQPQQEQQQLRAGLAERQVEELARSLRGGKGFFPGQGAYACCAVSSAAVEFYLSVLTDRRGLELPNWPAPLLFLLAYNVLRLRHNRAPEPGRVIADPAAASAAIPLAASAAIGLSRTAAATQRRRLLSSATEAAAAQLLLKVVGAIEAAVTFPDAVNIQCRLETHAYTDDGAVDLEHKTKGQQLSSENGGAGTAARKEPTVALVNEAAGAGRQCNICFAGLREVGSFLWALNRAEGVHGSPTANAAMGTVLSASDAGVLPTPTSLPPSPAGLCGGSRPNKPLTIQEASRIAAQAIKRPGGFADRFAVYCEAIIREANGRLLQCGASYAAARRNHSRWRWQQQNNIRAAAADGRKNDGEKEPRCLSALKALQAFCKEAPDAAKPVVSLRQNELPPFSWISTAGVSLGLLLNFFSSCRPRTRQHIMSAVLHAPLLAEECGLLQLFHLLRPLAASTRAEMEPAGDTAAAVSSFRPRDHKQHQLVQQQHESSAAAGVAQQLRASRSSSGILPLLKEVPAFLFALAVGLLRHAEAVLSLPAATPTTVAQVQLLLLASSDFATLLHAHCHSDEASYACERNSRPHEEKPDLATASPAFRHVLQEFLSLFSSIVVRHSGQVCGSLALLSAAAEVLSRCGRQVQLPPESRKAMEAFAPAAIAVLREPSTSHIARGPLFQVSRGPILQVGVLRGQRVGGMEELKRLAASLEALKFVKL